MNELPRTFGAIRRNGSPDREAWERINVVVVDLDEDSDAPDLIIGSDGRPQKVVNRGPLVKAARAAGG